MGEEGEAHILPPGPCLQGIAQCHPVFIKATLNDALLEKLFLFFLNAVLTL